MAHGRDRGDGGRGRGEGHQSPRHRRGRDPEAKTKELIAEYTERFANPYIAAQRGYVDAVIEAHRTRSAISTSLDMLENKRVERPKRKHGNIPL